MLFLIFSLLNKSKLYSKLQKHKNAKTIDFIDLS